MGRPTYEEMMAEVRPEALSDEHPRSAWNPDKEYDKRKHATQVRQAEALESIATSLQQLVKVLNTKKK